MASNDLNANKDLHTLYENVYAGDKGQHFLKYRGGKRISEAHEKAMRWLADHGCSLETVLDFGCGEGDFLGHLQRSGRRVGIDYAEKAIETARERYPEVDFRVGRDGDLASLASFADVVTCFGVLEHSELPQRTLGDLVASTKPDGVLLVSCPSFYNVRGIIWMTLALLWDVPMSLSDRHYLALPDLREMGAAHGADLVEAFSAEHSVAQGEDFGRDMRRRLTNALRDARMSNANVEKTVSWFERNLTQFASHDLSGAETVYVFRRRGEVR
jgi:SAM-dependent methyltransferase